MCVFIHPPLYRKSKKGNWSLFLCSLRRASLVLLLLRIRWRLFGDAAIACIPESESTRLSLIHKTKVNAHHATFAATFFRRRLTRCAQAVVRIRASLRQIEGWRGHVTIIRLARWGIGVAVRVSRCAEGLETGHGLLSKPSLGVARRGKVRVELMAGRSDAVRWWWKGECYLPDRGLVLLYWFAENTRKVCQEKLDQRSRNVKSWGEDDSNCSVLILMAS